MTSYHLTLINGSKGIHQTIDIQEGVSILDAANEADIRLPFLCRTGDCSNCVCKLVAGSAEQGPQTVLSGAELEAGYILACSTVATSDITIETHKEKELMALRRQNKVRQS